MSSGEGTYLESFLESLTTLPYQVRRNLELVQDLDRSYQDDMARLHELQAAYLQQVEEKVLQLEVVPMDVDSKSTSTKQEMGVRVIRDDDEGYDKKATEALPAMIPTTTELVDYAVPDDNSETTKMIQKLQGDVLQKADEKVAVVRQTYHWMDAVVQRLDRDLVALSEKLQAQGEFRHPDAPSTVNELAACQVGSEWILGKVLEHDTKTGMYKLADEDIESEKIFHLPEEQVVILRRVEGLAKGDTVFAVYPDTTSFYQASIVQMPRKSSAAQAFALVNFVDDSDEFGVTPDRAVLLQHIMLPPYGTTIQ